VTYKISLVVTSYNSSKFIKKSAQMLNAAESFLHEIIFVDDCSNDETQKLINDFISSGNRYKKFFFYSLSKNSGRPSKPRNLGKSKASGDWIVFCDIDDLIPVRYFKYLTTQKPLKILSLTKFPIENQSCYQPDISIDTDTFIKINIRQLKFKNMISLSGAAVPKKYIDLETFPKGVLEDWKYWHSLALHGVEFLKFTNIPVFYWSPTTLSPKKKKQIERVASLIGWHRIPFYIFYTLKLKRWENNLFRRINNEF